MVYGESLKNCCVAVVVPDRGEVTKWAKRLDKKGDLYEWVKDPDLKAAVLLQINELAI